MSRIEVDLHALRQASQRCREASRQIQDILHDARQTLSRMNWDGLSRVRFEDQMRAWERELSQRAASLENLAREISHTAERLARADRQSSSDRR